MVTDSTEVKALEAEISVYLQHICKLSGRDPLNIRPSAGKCDNHHGGFGRENFHRSNWRPCNWVRCQMVTTNSFVVTTVAFLFLIIIILKKPYN